MIDAWEQRYPQIDLKITRGGSELPARVGAELDSGTKGADYHVKYMMPNIEVIAEAGSGEAALRILENLSPDVVVMDLAMGAGMDGIDAIKEIRQRNAKQAVLVFTTYDSDADIVRAVDAGAMGYLLKDAAPEEIFSAVRGASNGKSVMSAPVASKLFRRLRNPDEALTPREAELLSLLVEGLGNKELSQRLFISEATVKTHLAHIYAKLGVETRVEAITTALRREGMR